MPAAGPAEECTTHQLSIEITAQPASSGAGQSYSEITFTNTGETACLLLGSPSVFNLVDTRTGAVIGKRSPDEGVEERVEIEPGEVGYSTIHFSAAGAYDCETGVADGALVAPPEPQTTGPVEPIRLEQSVTVCLDPATYSVSNVASSSAF